MKIGGQWHKYPSANYFGIKYFVHVRDTVSQKIIQRLAFFEICKEPFGMTSHFHTDVTGCHLFACYSW